MKETNISNNKNELPLWDLSEIYKDIKDPKIKNDFIGYYSNYRTF